MRAILIFILLAANLFLQAQTVQPDSNTPIVLDGTNPKSIRATLLKSDKPFSFEKAKLAKPNPLFVRFGGNVEVSFNEAITASLDSALFTITVDMTKVRKPGDYSATFVINPDEGKAVYLTVPMTRPGAVLDTISTLKIEYVQGNVSSDSLMIKETGGASNVQQISSVLPVVQDQFNRKYFEIDPSSFGVPAGSFTKRVIKVNSSEIAKLPLGVTKGRLEVTAPESPNKLTIPFTITKRLYRVWIFVILLLGVTLGFLIRRYLKLRKDTEEQKFLAAQLLAQIDRDASNIADEDYKKEITALTQKLRDLLLEKTTLLKLDKSAAFSQEITSVTTNYNLKKTEFDTRLKTARDKLAELSLDNIIKFDSALTTRLATASALYTECVTLVNEKNAGAAQKKLEGLELELKDVLADFYEKFGDRLKNILNIFPAVAPQSLKDQLNAKMPVIKTKLDLIPSNAGTEKLFMRFKYANDVQEDWRAQMQISEAAIDQLFQQDYKQTGTAVMQEFYKKYKAWKEYADKLTNDVSADVNNQPVEQLNKAWDAAVKESKQPDAPATAESLEAVTFTLAGTKQSPAINFPMLTEQEATNPIAVAASRAAFWYWTFEVLQSGLLLLLMVAVAYTTYAPAFIGTWQEIIGIFFFAFSLDITVDNLLQFKPKS